MIFAVFILIVFNSVTSGLKTCGDCQRYTLCSQAASLVTRQQDDFTLAKFRKAKCGFDSAFQEVMVCCSDFVINPLINRQGADETEDDPSQALSEKLKLLPEDCGNTDGRRIVGGENAKIYEFPWMALIAYNYSGRIQYECSGSIISSKYILTAAHCVLNQPLAGVRVGDFDVRWITDCQGEQENLVCESFVQDINIEDFIVHEGFTLKHGARSSSDIALLRVKENIDTKNHRNIKPICLPVLPDLRNMELAGEQATVTGWGLTERGKESSVLRKVLVPIKSEQYCRTSGSGNKNELCAGDINKDSCKGDSGGPLVLVTKYNNIFRAVQFGIVSHGPMNCGSKSGAYTDVRKYADWILESIRD